MIILMLVISAAAPVLSTPRTMIPTSGTGRKAPEIDGKRKQFSGSEARGFIPATSDHFPSEQTAIWPEDNGKIRKFSSLEYCFHEITGTLRN
jgi:hypothetical protein